MFARKNDPVSTTILVSRPHIAILINGEELISDTAKELAMSYPRSTRRKEAEAAESHAVDWKGRQLSAYCKAR